MDNQQPSPNLEASANTTQQQTVMDIQPRKPSTPQPTPSEATESPTIDTPPEKDNTHAPKSNAAKSVVNKDPSSSQPTLAIVMAVVIAIGLASLTVYIYTQSKK